MVSMIPQNINRADQYKQEIYEFARVWWESVAPHCARFFEISSQFNRVDGIEKKQVLLDKMHRRIAKIKSITCSDKIESMRDDLLSAMNGLTDSLEAGMNNQQVRSTTRLHEALLDLQHFHVILDRLELDYSAKPGK
ncbi:MAG: hypothetical protein RLP44_20220 [Aggregatilineales bacterium]